MNICIESIDTWFGTIYFVYGLWVRDKGNLVVSPFGKL